MDNFISEDVKLAVKKGANWLDLNHPGWAHKLDINKLNMDDCQNCVIGQAVGNYWETIGGTRWAIEHGFDTPSNSTDIAAQGYADLETLWTNEVKKRLG